MHSTRTKADHGQGRPPLILEVLLLLQAAQSSPCGRGLHGVSTVKISYRLFSTHVPGVWRFPPYDIIFPISCWPSHVLSTTVSIRLSPVEKRAGLLAYAWPSHRIFPKPRTRDVDIRGEDVGPGVEWTRCRHHVRDPDLLLKSLA